VLTVKRKVSQNTGRINTTTSKIQNHILLLNLTLTLTLTPSPLLNLFLLDLII